MSQPLQAQKDKMLSTQSCVKHIACLASKHLQLLEQLQSLLLQSPPVWRCCMEQVHC